MGVPGFNNSGISSYSVNRSTKSSFYFHCLTVLLRILLNGELANFKHNLLRFLTEMVTEEV